jgi:hypothetical protein
VTERQRLQLLLQAEGLQLSADEEEALFNAWTSYKALIEKLRQQVRLLDLEP